MICFVIINGNFIKILIYILFFSIGIFFINSILLCKNPIPPKYQELLPDFGKWMYIKDKDNNFIPSNWLGVKVNGKTLFEPINLIIIDEQSKSIEKSDSLISEILDNVGFSKRNGHTAQYYGIIDGNFYGQLPQIGSDRAFSNYHWSLTNDHIRLFGPVLKNNRYIWTGNASREKGISHSYISFRKAINELEKNILSYSNATILGYFFLDNQKNEIDSTTGDHNGYCLVIMIK